MKVDGRGGTPLSRLASLKLADVRRGFIERTFILFLAGSFVMMLGLILIGEHVTAYDVYATQRNTLALAAALAVVIAGGLVYSFFFWRRTRRGEVLRGNKQDYLLGLKVQEITKSFQLPVSQGGVLEPVLGSWKVFRVERYPANILRGEIEGTLSGRISLLPWRFSGTLEASMLGMSLPDLLDMSTLVFMSRGDEETLRLIIPSSRVTKEMFAGFVQAFLGEVEMGTHVHAALAGFHLDDTLLLGPVSHPAFIDRLDLATQWPENERPLVTVKGLVVQNGVALATALDVKGTDLVFFPSRYFGELGKQLATLVGQPPLPTVERLR